MAHRSRFPADALASRILPVFLLPAIASAALGSANAEEERAYLGSYWSGNHFSYTELNLKKDLTFLHTWIADDGQQVSIVGKYVRSGSRVVLAPDRPQPAYPFLGKVASYNFVTWGQRIYLIPDSDAGLLRFCNDLNLGLEPRTYLEGLHLIRAEPTRKMLAGLPPEFGTVSALPDLPAQWKPFLLVRALKGKSSVVTSEWELQANLGSNQGLRSRMALFLAGDCDDGKQSYAIAQVTEVRREDCTARIIYRSAKFRLAPRQSVLSAIPKTVLEEDSLRLRELEFER